MDYTVKKLIETINQRNTIQMNLKTHSRNARLPSIDLQRKIVTELSAESLYLYQYYVSKAHAKTFDLLDDKKVGQVIGWSGRKVQEHRLRLTNAKFILFQKKTIQGVKYCTWVFGKDKVEQFEMFSGDMSQLESDEDITDGSTEA